MYQFVSEISRWAIPLFILIVPLVAAARGVKVFETFVEGAEQGFALAIKLIPYLVAMLVAITVFRQSGAMEVMGQVLGPGLARLGFPVEVLPHAILRPLSGGAALGVAAELMKTHGPDSFVGHLVSTMQGASDTTVNVLNALHGRALASGPDGGSGRPAKTKASRALKLRERTRQGSARNPYFSRVSGSMHTGRHTEGTPARGLDAAAGKGSG